MPKRVKPNLSPAAFPVHSLEDVDAALAQIAARKRQIDLIGLGVAEQVDLAALDLAEHGSQLGHYRGDERQYVVDVFLPRLAAVGDAVRCG